ncbi:glycosyltransferase [Robertmurraya yapensis]|uniref:Glycosyltransferase n=2 Tax=Bacillus yapensis TaxID=2492960 RepID=A0A3S0K652_9BACI|nr:glycosyltransferase [Bacillus yapensis]TKT05941.1 glycosyltransferase [Bacillus yapensis]
MAKEPPSVIIDRSLSRDNVQYIALNYSDINSRIKNNENHVDLPLVSVLIPTYNRPDYFERALQSAIQQTYQNIEIVIGDDSTDNETELLVKNNYLPYYNNIRYIKNETNLGQFDNDLKLFELAQGEFVNFLMDDDVFHPEKVEKMMEYYLNDQNEEITLVTSHRRFINEKDELLKEEGVTQKVFDQDTVMDGKEFGNMLLKYNFNFVGEPTTVLFRKKDLDEPFGTFAGRRYGCNVDSATWLTLLAKGKGVYISETLSYFRIHNGQQLQSDKMKFLGANDYANSVLLARKKGFLQENIDYLTALNNSMNYLDSVTKVLNNDFYKQELTNTYNYLHDECLELEIPKYNKQDTSYPLVSILIPSYNRPKMLEEALISALNQSYQNIEIIISDDSTTDEVQKVVEKYLNKYSNLHYYKNEIPLVEDNYDQCFNLANGEYINFLNDDDLFHPNKIEIMMNYIQGKEGITLVTSHRQVIDEEGEYLPDIGATTKISNEVTIINGRDFGNLLLKNQINIIGEPSSVLFRKEDLIECFGYIGGKRLSFINDITTWIALLQKGNAVYIPESLSYFRIHSNQAQQNLKYLFTNIYQWSFLINYSRKLGFLSLERDYKNALNKLLTVGTDIFNKYISEGNTSILNEKQLLDALAFIISEIIQGTDKYYCNLCHERFNEFLPLPDIYVIEKFEFENNNVKTALCPNCYSMDRERAFKLFIEEETDIKEQKTKVLHIAPEKNIRNWLISLKNIDYTCGDLFPSDRNMEKIDITNIQYNDNSFEFIICSHVLEHVPDDSKAMKELCRILKQGGKGILQVPIALNLDETYEDDRIISPEDRLLNFGQEDHVRVYAKDYIQKLENAGFIVCQYNFAEKNGVAEAEKYGLTLSDIVYIVSKE